MKSGDECLALTAKGTEALHNRTHPLDVTARNILSLIEQGLTTPEALLQRSIFPHNSVLEGLRRLLGNQFVMVCKGDGAAQPGANGNTEPANSDGVRLKFGISLSQARFALSEFCLDQFATAGQHLVDLVELCGDVIGLQAVLNSIRAEVVERAPDRLPALTACVRKINDTDEAIALLPAADSPRSKGARTKQFAGTDPVSVKPASLMPPRPASAARAASSGSSAAEQLRLESGISLSQARFALTDFCLNQFGVQGQTFLDALGRCSDVAGLQKVLSKIRSEVLDRHLDRLPTLAACVREINDTSV